MKDLCKKNYIENRSVFKLVDLLLTESIKALCNFGKFINAQNEDKNIILFLFCFENILSIIIFSIFYHLHLIIVLIIYIHYYPADYFKIMII